MKTQNIIKTAGLISAFSCLTIVSSSCDDSDSPSSTISGGKIDFSSLLLTRDFTNHPFENKFTLSSTFLESFEGSDIVVENTLIHSVGDIGARLRLNIINSESSGDELQSISLASGNDIYLLTAYFDSIDSIISTGKGFSGDQLRAARDKSLNSLQLSSEEARVLSSLSPFTSYDSSGNLYIIEYIDIDLVSGNHTSRGRIFHFTTNTDIEYTGSSASVSYQFKTN